MEVSPQPYGISIGSPKSTAAGFRTGPNVSSSHIATFRCAAEFGRYRGHADEQAATIKLDL
jgi:hypothetical protein